MASFLEMIIKPSSSLKLSFLIFRQNSFSLGFTHWGMCA